MGETLPDGSNPLLRDKVEDEYAIYCQQLKQMAVNAWNKRAAVMLFGGPYNGTIIKTDSQIWDVPILEATLRELPNNFDSMCIEKIRVHRYRRISKDKMNYQGIFKR